jgi:hypothetical protein
VADDAKVSVVNDCCEHRDAVFTAECNDFYRIVVLQRRVCLKDKYGWMYDGARRA